MPPRSAKQTSPVAAKQELQIYNCTACRCKIKSSLDAKLHPLIDCLVCRKCYRTYGDGDFAINWPDGVDEFGDDNYCRWCCDGGDLFGCMHEENGERCHYSFCKDCIQNNVPEDPILTLATLDDEEKEKLRWLCYSCDKSKISKLRQYAKDAIKDLIKAQNAASAKRTEDLATPAKQRKEDPKTSTASLIATTATKSSSEIKVNGSSANKETNKEPIKTTQDALNKKSEDREDPTTNPAKRRKEDPKTTTTASMPTPAKQSKEDSKTTANAPTPTPAKQSKEDPKATATTPSATPANQRKEDPKTSTTTPMATPAKRRKEDPKTTTPVSTPAPAKSTPAPAKSTPAPAKSTPGIKENGSNGKEANKDLIKSAPSKEASKDSPKPQSAPPAKEVNKDLNKTQTTTPGKEAYKDPTKPQISITAKRSEESVTSAKKRKEDPKTTTPVSTPLTPKLIIDIKANGFNANEESPRIPATTLNGISPRLVIYSKTKDVCIEEIGTQFESLLEMIKAGKSKKTIDIKIDGLRKPIQEFETMLNDIRNM